MRPVAHHKYVDMIVAGTTHNIVVMLVLSSNKVQPGNTSFLRPLEYGWNIVGIFQPYSNYIPNIIVSTIRNHYLGFTDKY